MAAKIPDVRVRMTLFEACPLIHQLYRLVHSKLFQFRSESSEICAEAFHLVFFVKGLILHTYLPIT
jgi:hypothetical protein